MYDVEIQVLAWDKHKNMAGINLIDVIPTLASWISNS